MKDSLIKDEPTQEQLKRFWEWCGFWHKDSKIWVYPNGDVGITPETLFYPPDINLNNLFKYAITKLEGRTKLNFNFKPLSVSLYKEVGQGSKPLYYESRMDNYSNPALALFWAIYQVIENKE